jgi:hypothetical protein
MALPKEITNKGYKTVYIGLTTIALSRKDATITITHAGNMGNTIASVRENFDMEYGAGSFDSLIKRCKKMEENGSPDYLYTRKMWF